MPVILLCALIGAAAFRLRGDDILRTWLGWGTLEGRALYASSVALSCTVLTLPVDGWALPLLACALVLALFAGSVIGWWQSLDMGTQTGSLARDMALHSLRGVIWTLPAGGVVAVLDIPAGTLIALSGAAAGPIYAAAMLAPWEAKLGPVWISRRDGNGVNTELGECLFGGWIGGCLCAALLAVR